MESYINSKKKLYSAILEFLENSDDDNLSELNHLVDIVTNQHLEGDLEEMKDFLKIIKNISDNHHRHLNFMNRINNILQQFKDKIKQTLSNDEIFEIFRSNKIIVLFLLKSDILTITESIYKEMISKLDPNGMKYCYFFYPEIEKFIGEEKMKDIKNELLEKDPQIFENFENNRQEGENDSYLCSLIRQDSVKEFITYINRTNYPLSSSISPSIFETNSFLIENKNITLIEYSAFFGSIQIFKYLQMNKVELTPSLWLYAIHSKKAELIHLLESNKVCPPIFKKQNNDENNEEDENDENEQVEESSDDNYLECFIESIKCHHNDIAEYIKNNLLNQEEEEQIISHIIKYHNYNYFQINTVVNHGFIYFCLYDYSKLVNLLLTQKKDEIDNKIIHKLNIFINYSFHSPFFLMEFHLKYYFNSI